MRSWLALGIYIAVRRGRKRKGGKVIEGKGRERKMGRKGEEREKEKLEMVD